MLSRTRIVSCAAGLLAVGSTHTWAQDAPAQTTGSSTLEEVIVSAQRREESAQKTSLAIEVLSADAISKAGITDPASIANVVSGVNIAFAGSSVQTFIRGVGSFVTNSFADSAIAYSVDGVYISRPPAIAGVFYDLERIEVLKGPQGTLYGRNASGGAINLITRRPTQDFGGTVSAEVGDYNLIKLSGAVNLPVTDTLALRAAFQSNEHDGYAADGYYDDDTRSARLHALYTPNEDISLLVTTDVTELGGKGPIGIRIGAGDPSTDDPWNDRAASAPQGLPSFNSPVPWAGDLYAPRDDGYIDTNLWNISAQLDWDLQAATLTIIPAYRNMQSNTRTYAPGFLFENDETSDQSSFEVRLGNSTDDFKWVGGAYYFHEHQNQMYSVDQGVNTTAVDTPTLDTDSWAVFGETTFSLMPELRAILGARYTHEEKEMAGTQSNLFPYPTFVWTYVLHQMGPEPFPLPGVVSGETSADKATWKAGLEYDLAPESMLFFTASEGFKAGGVIPTKFADPTYKPETLLAFELGSRNRFLDNRLQVNAEAFYWKYRDKQEASVRYDDIEGVNYIIRNASKATMYGANLDLAWQATPNDRFDVGAEYLHTKYDDFTYVLNSSGTTGCVETPRGDGNFIIDCSGEQLPKAPTFSGNVGYSHVFDLPNGGALTAAARGQFSSSTYQDISYAPVAKSESWQVYDADLTYESPGNTWSVGAWIRNISDEVVYTGGSLYPFTPQVFYATIRPPRTYGLRAVVNF